MGNTFAGLRARNNLLGVLEPVDLEATLALTREIYDIAQRFGQRTWVQQAISSGSSSSFDAGDWDAWVTEMADEEPMAAELYRHWFHCEQAIRMAYRGDIAGATRIFEEALASPAVLASFQISVAARIRAAHLRMLEGRFADAFDATREGWAQVESATDAIGLALLTAMAAGDRERLREAVVATEGLDEQPTSVALRQMGAVYLALIEGRWSEARSGFAVAMRQLEAIHHLRVLAAFRMAVGHLAGDRFPEAIDALRDAETFFTERGADTVVANYRARAATAANSPIDRAHGRCRVDARRWGRLTSEAPERLGRIASGDQTPERWGPLRRRSGSSRVGVGGRSARVSCLGAAGRWRRRTGRSAPGRRGRSTAIRTEASRSSRRRPRADRSASRRTRRTRGGS